MKKFIKLNKLQPGDKVAILSPSSGLPGLFPWVQDFGLQRLRDIFGLVPVEYPTTRQMGSSLEDRARDLMSAFRDPQIKAIITSIGGSDQIRLIKHLDLKVLSDNPKPFFGFSDNTHIGLTLWNLGIPSYYGASILTQFAMQNKMHPMTIESINSALFNDEVYDVVSSPKYNDEGLKWSDKNNLTKDRKWEDNDGLYWDGNGDVSGRLWGGCVESLVAQFTVGKYLPDKVDLKDAILFIETAESIPDEWVLDYLLTGMGERGWFDNFKAVLVGRPKAWEYDKQNSVEQKHIYRQKQRETIVKTIRLYNKTMPIIQNLDFGHTDPQIIIPNGNLAEISCSKKTIKLHM